MNPVFKNFFPTGILTYISDHSVDYTLNVSTQNQALPLTENQKEDLFKHTNIRIEQLTSIKQVHENGILPIINQRQFEMASLREADGWITNLEDIPLVIRTADCLPVFLFDSKAGCIGLVHAGWRGTNAGIVRKAVEMMGEEFDADIGSVQAAFGPAIHKCCYQVGEEFLKYFPRETTATNGRYHFDLIQANQNQLLGLGLKPEQIFDVDICTCCDHNYFSYRRQGPRAGRMLSLMMIHKRE